MSDTTIRTVQEVAEQLFQAIKAQQVQIDHKNGGLVFDGIAIARQPNTPTITRQAYF
jgi:hypothetical protein